MDWTDKQLAVYERILDSGRTFAEKTQEIMLLEAKNLTFLSEEFRNFQTSEERGISQTIQQYSEEKVKDFL